MSAKAPRRLERRYLYLFLVTIAFVCTSALMIVIKADAQNGTFIPTGVRITPTAAPGSSFQPLNPGLPTNPGFIVGQAVTTAVSPDGQTLLVLTSGFNRENFTSGANLGRRNPAESNEYIFVFNISGSELPPFQDSAHHLHRKRKPHLRSDPRRSGQRQWLSLDCSLSATDHAQPACVGQQFC